MEPLISGLLLTGLVIYAIIATVNVNQRRKSKSPEYATIVFEGVADAEGLTSAFEYIRSVRNDGASIDEDRMRALLGDVEALGFIDLPAGVTRDPSHVESDKWDFGSWIDALNSAEQNYRSIEMRDRAGELTFYQLAWPSGGVQAIEQLIRAFGGRIVINDAV